MCPAYDAELTRGVSRLAAQLQKASDVKCVASRRCCSSMIKQAKIFKFQQNEVKTGKKATLPDVKPSPCRERQFPGRGMTLLEFIHAITRVGQMLSKWLRGGSSLRFL